MEDPFQGEAEVLKHEIPSRLENRHAVIQSILDELSRRKFDVDELSDRLILDEAITNAIVHGNVRDAEKMVRVRLFCREDCWGVEIVDEGEGFDWEALRARLESKELNVGTSGRGIALILACGAKLHILNGGKRIVIVRDACPDADRSEPGR